MPAPSAFDITLTYDSGVAFTQAQKDAIRAAADRWEEIIVGDLPEESGIDDIELFVTASSDTGDGYGVVGGTLATGGSTALRAVGKLPYTGTVTFDAADLADVTANGQLLPLTTHEIGHALGVGSLWDDSFFNFVAGAGTGTPTYTGTSAVDAYAFTFGTTVTEIPIDSPGEAHWDENDMGGEIMTPALETAGTFNPISIVTIGALEDLGYTVEYLQADVFNGKSGADYLASFTVAPKSAQNTIAITVTANFPGLTSFTRITPADEITNADTLTFRALFDEAVQGVDRQRFRSHRNLRDDYRHQRCRCPNL